MTLSFNWQPTSPIDAIMFDCDGTLSMIEGIDELAKLKKVDQKVRLLTEVAMNHTGINPELYRKRLDLVCPNLSEVENLGLQYFANTVPHAAEIIALLQRVGKTVYLVSAGVNPAIHIFGKLLAVPQENIFAVNIEFDAEGNFLNFDHRCVLVHREGKRKIAAALKQKHNRVLHIGDGMNDVVTSDLVDRFVGYGGVFFRESIAAKCDFYIRSLSLTPLLPLLLTLSELKQLLPEETRLYEAGIDAIANDGLLIPLNSSSV